MQKVNERPEVIHKKFGFHELKKSSTDQVIFLKSNGELVGWQVYSEIMDEWFEIPLDIIRVTYPNKLEMAQIEVDEMRTADPENYCQNSIQGESA